MTATQVFLLFLKEECTIKEMKFFKQIIIKDCGNKYFRKRPLFTMTFVEDYLSRNNRALNNFMTRLFILAPNLKRLRHINPRWKMIKEEFALRNKGKIVKHKYTLMDGRTIWRERPCVFNPCNCGMYVNYYRHKWNNFINNNIDSDKKFNSPFRKGEQYIFNLKTDDTN